MLTQSSSQGYARSMASTQSLEELMAALQRLGRLLASRQATSRVTTAAGTEVSHQGVALLRVLLREGQQPVARLAALAPMDIAAVSRQVRMLEAAGAVQRSRSPDDGRVALLELTDEGRDIAERIKAVGVRHLQDALRDWPEADAKQLAELMKRLTGDLMATPIQPA